MVYDQLGRQEHYEKLVQGKSRLKIYAKGWKNRSEAVWCRYSCDIEILEEYVQDLVENSYSVCNSEVPIELSPEDLEIARQVAGVDGSQRTRSIRLLVLQSA